MSTRVLKHFGFFTSDEGGEQEEDAPGVLSFKVYQNGHNYLDGVTEWCLCYGFGCFKLCILNSNKYCLN